MKIEKNIPIPKYKYPFDQMEVGDSILCDGEKTSNCRAYSSAKRWGLRTGKCFTARKDKKPGKIRIWRTK